MSLPTRAGPPFHTWGTRAVPETTRRAMPPDECPASRSALGEFPADHTHPIDLKTQRQLEFLQARLQD